jgi:flagellar export protein FliJ
MAAFKFRLQSILDFRSGLVDRARMEVGALQARQRDQELVRERLRTEERATFDALAEQQAGGALDMAELTRLMGAADALATRIEEQGLVIERCRREADAAQVQLVELSKEAKALEKLRERQQDEHLQDDARRERAETSELASLRHRWMQVARMRVAR